MVESPAKYTFSMCFQDMREDLEFYGGKDTASKFATFLFGKYFKMMFLYSISRYLNKINNKSYPLHIYIRYQQGILGGNEFNYRAIIGKKNSFSSSLRHYYRCWCNH